LLLQGSKGNFGFSYPQIHCRRCRSTKICYRKILPLGDDRGQGYQDSDEDIKAENIVLPDEFVSELLIEKLPQSWTDYKQQLKHRHKQMSLPYLVTHIIIEDTNRKECATARAKALLPKQM